MTDEIPGWFPETNKRVLDELIKEHGIKTVIEIGSFVGRSTAFFAERCEEVYAIEPFDALDNCDYLDEEMKKLAQNQRAEFDKNTAGFDNVVVIPTTSKVAFLSHDLLAADLIFIDGSHKYEDVRQDILLALPRANKIICGDDYSEWWPGVRQAVDELLPNSNTENRVWYYLKK